MNLVSIIVLSNLSIINCYSNRILYYKNYANKYITKYIENHPNNIGKSVIDIGCNTGYSTLQYKPAGSVGVDESLDMLKIARQLHPNKVFYKGCLDTFGPSKCFDTALLSFTISSNDNWEGILKNTHRLSKNGIIIQDYNPVINYLEKKYYRNYKIRHVIDNKVSILII